MSEPSETGLPELAQYLSLRAPGLALLRYHSAYAFDALVQSLRLPDRPLHLVRYRPRARDERASPVRIVQRCCELADSTVPVIFLCPDPDAEAASDLPAQAVFWKNLNASREALGTLSAQIILTVDDAQTAACFHHAKDLVSWCSPKFELTARAPAAPDADRLSITSERTTHDDGGTVSSLTWDSLHPLLQKEMESGRPLTPHAVTQLLLPLMRYAVKSGAVSRATRLVPVGDQAEFPDDHTRGMWLEMKGELAVAQGDLADALRFFTECMLIRQRLAASDPANTEWQRDLFVSLNHLGALAVAQGDLARALRRFSNAKFIAERFAASDPANAKWQRELSVSLIKIGDIAVAQGDLAAASRCFSDAKVIAERLAASDPANAAWQRDLSVSLEKLGNLAVAQGDLAGALRCFTESNAIFERLAASDPANAASQRDLAVSIGNLGNLAVLQGDLASASQRFADCMAIFERLAASDPANVVWQRDLSVSLVKLGDVALAQRNLVGALYRFTQSKAIAERLAASGPANAEWQRDLYVSLVKLGEVAVAQGNLPKALRCFTDSKAIAERLAASDPGNARWQRDLAVSHFKLYQFASKAGDNTTAAAARHACLTVLDGMKRRGLHFVPQLAQVYEQLRGMFGGE